MKFWLNSEAKRQSTGLMRRLTDDVAGNTLAIMAAALIPLAGMVGGGVDLSRMYIVKTRLQHACDAGALAGRKSMGGGTWSQSSYAPRTAAQQFFDANIQASPYGASDITKNFTEAAGKVTGTASAVVPMTIMRIFGRTTETLDVVCDAEMRLPNTDVMFVLDTTGSMDSKAVASDADKKIDALKKAVKCFYEIVARLDTNAVCDGGDPSGGTGNQVQIRFGFVPYATNVNVGKLLPTSYFADSWPYQTREARFHTEYDTVWTNGSPQTSSSQYLNESTGNYSTQNTYYGTKSQDETWCSGMVPPSSAWASDGTEGNPQNSNTATSGNTRTTTWRTDQDVIRYEYQYTWRASDKRCRIQRRDVTANLRRNYTQTDTSTQVARQVFDGYNYAKKSMNISGLKNGSAWRNSIQAPIGTQGANTTVNWDGCIEERATVRQTSYWPIPAGAKDLDIDTTPTSGSPETLWGPALPKMVFARNVQTSWDELRYADTLTTTGYYNSVPYYCPAEARKLQTWGSASSFETYVDSLTPDGNTYHDIGMIWGARLMSPTGMFRSENEFTPQGGEIERHLIFMTDGDTVARNNDYAAYGLPWLDRRQTSESSAPSDDDLSNQVNARFSAICNAVKNKNITLWVISFGSGSNTTTENRLQACATAGRYFVARDSATLQQTFRSIADQISALRLTR